VALHLSVFPTFQTLKQLTDSYENCNEYCVTVGQIILSLFNFLQSVTTTWQTYELVRWSDSSDTKYGVLYTN
jgi:hypothetical protein